MDEGVSCSVIGERGRMIRGTSRSYGISRRPRRKMIPIDDGVGWKEGQGSSNKCVEHDRNEVGKSVKSWVQLTMCSGKPLALGTGCTCLGNCNQG